MGFLKICHGGNIEIECVSSFCFVFRVFILSMNYSSIWWRSSGVLIPGILGSPYSIVFVYFFIQETVYIKKMIVFSFRIRVYNGRISNQEFVQSFWVCHGKSSVPETCAWVIFCNILTGFIFGVLDQNTTKPWAGSGNIR